jgi:hypothetical protein
VRRPPYVIDWLENLPHSPFTWPATSRVVTNTVSTQTISPGDGITITSAQEDYNQSSNAVKLTVEGVTFYVCALDSKDQPGAIKPGCIIYDGVPDDSFRKKVRVSLSFALGLYLVDLGTTHYDSEWQIVSTLARSAYSLGRHAFEIQTLQLAPLGPRFLNELTAAQLTRAVQAFVSAFDTLDLANLHWAAVIFAIGGWWAARTWRQLWRAGRSPWERLVYDYGVRGFGFSTAVGLTAIITWLGWATDSNGLFGPMMTAGLLAGLFFGTPVALYLGYFWGTSFAALTGVEHDQRVEVGEPPHLT